MPSSTSKIETKNIKLFLGIHLLTTIASSGLMYCAASQSWFHNFLISQVFIWLSLSSLSFSVWLFFLKKNIALLIGVIVFKWPILGIVLYKTVTLIELETVPFSLGFFSVLLSSIIWAFLQKE